MNSKKSKGKDMERETRKGGIKRKANKMKKHEFVIGLLILLSFLIVLFYLAVSRGFYL